MFNGVKLFSLKRQKFKAIAAGTAAALVLSGFTAAGAQADEGTIPVATDEVAEVVDAIEQITGTEDLLALAPGDSTETVYVPEDLSEAIELNAGGISVDFEQPVAGDVEAEVVVSDEGTISFINEEEDFNTHLQVLGSPDEDLLSDGVRSIIEIQSADAPSDYEFPVNGPEGMVLEVQDDGSVLGLVNGELSLIVPAPWAFDANGVEVPTSYSVREGALIQHVGFTSENVFPVLADPVWFVPLIVVGARVVGQIAVTAVSRAAAVRAAAAVAARTVVKKVSGRITSAAAKRCYKGAAVGTGASVPAYVQQMGNGSWQVRFNGNGVLATVSASVAGCLSANIR